MKTDGSFVVATRSTHKLAEIIHILAGCATVVTLQDAGVPQSDDEEGIECFETFRDNALAKARYFMQITGRPTIADDSGIVVDALDGRPGVRSKRYALDALASGAQAPEGDALDLANNHRVARELADVAADARTAHYVCAAALALPNGEVFTALGSCTGLFLSEPRGTAGFGYDPHFLLPAIGRTFGELDDVQKHRYSHRARAFRALAPHLG